MGKEMIYDDVAMENARLLLIEAKSGLKRAKNNYNSSKLAGENLVTEAESFMSDIEPYLANYNHATDTIYTGSSSMKSLSFHQPTSSQTVASTQDPWESLPSVSDERLDPTDTEETSEEINFKKYSKGSFQLQEALCAMGFLQDGIDGVIGSNTIKALKEFFSNMLGNGSNIITESDEITLEHFESLLQSYSDFLEDLEEKIISGTATNEEKVKYAQHILQSLGYYPASEGINGAANTYSFKCAIETYCEANGIDSVDPENMSFEFLREMGKNPKTYAELKLEKYSPILSGNSTLNMDNPEQREDIQRMLKASGYYLGPIDGNQVVGDEMMFAVKHLLEDRGLGSFRIKSWSEISIDMLEAIVTTEKKGLEGFKFSENWTPEDGFIGVAAEKSEYFATHGYGYCTSAVRYIDTNSSINIPRCNIREEFLEIEKDNDLYIVDCSAGVESCIYDYLKACGFETLAESFTGNMAVVSFKNYYEAGGKVNGAQVFDIVSNSNEIQPGDIIMHIAENESDHNHMEIYSDINEEGKLLVYNWGSSEAIRVPGVTVDEKRGLDKYQLIMRIKTPEELKAEELKAEGLKAEAEAK